MMPTTHDRDESLPNPLGEHLYVLEQGVFAAIVPPRDGIKAAARRPGRDRKEPQRHLYAKTPWGTYPSFGEMALLGGKGRPATVTAETDGSLWRLHKECYQWCLAEAGAHGAGQISAFEEEEGSLQMGMSLPPAQACVKDPETIRELEVAPPSLNYGPYIVTI
jgi:hypothetical protein